MNRIKLIYKKCDDQYTTGNEWDYLRDTDWGGQVWSCCYTLDTDATMSTNNFDKLPVISKLINVYTEDVTDEELDTLGESNYDRLPWDDYEYYTTLGDLVDWAGSSVIPCVMDGNNVIIDVTVDDSGEIMGV